MVRFESAGRQLGVVSFRKNEGLIFDQHPDASPLNVAIGFQPVFPGLLDGVRRKHDWRNKEFKLDAAVDSGCLRFSGFRGDREGLPGGVYDISVEVESFRFSDSEQRITIKGGRQAEMVLHETPDLRRVKLRGGIDPVTAAILDHKASTVDGEPVRQWLASERPRAARHACLLNILAKLRVPPAPAHGLPEPLTESFDFLYFAQVDRVYAAARPGLLTRLERLTQTKLWAKEGRPKAAIHRRLLTSLPKLGVPEADAKKFKLISYRQGGRNCLQIVVAAPPAGFADPTVYTDLDIDLGNPLWDVEGALVHLGELLDPARTDHLALHAKLDRSDTKDFLYYEVVKALPAAA